MKCRDCIYFQSINHDDYCTLLDNGVRYDYSACEHFTKKINGDIDD